MYYENHNMRNNILYIIYTKIMYNYFLYIKLFPTSNFPFFQYINILHIYYIFKFYLCTIHTFIMCLQNDKEKFAF